MAGSGTRPTAKTYADLCFDKVYDKKSIDEAEMKCRGVQGLGKTTCIASTHREALIKYAQTKLQNCAKTVDIKAICTYPNCDTPIRDDIRAYLRGEDPVADREKAAAAKVAANDVATVLVAEQNLPIPASFSEQAPDPQTSHKSKVPWKLLGCGAAALVAVYFITRK